MKSQGQKTNWIDAVATVSCVAGSLTGKEWLETIELPRFKKKWPSAHIRESKQRPNFFAIFV